MRQVVDDQNFRNLSITFIFWWDTRNLPSKDEYDLKVTARKENEWSFLSSGCYLSSPGIANLSCSLTSDSRSKTDQLHFQTDKLTFTLLVARILNATRRRETRRHKHQTVNAWSSYRPAILFYSWTTGTGFLGHSYQLVTVHRSIEPLLTLETKDGSVRLVTNCQSASH